MKILEVKDYQQMSNKAAEYIIEKVIRFPSIKLGLATGGTPIGTYKKLIEDHQKNGTSYRRVTTFNLDEYIGLSEENKNSYRYYMNENLFNHIDIEKSRTFIPRGDVDDIQKESLYYEDLIAKHSGIDLQVLGIGSNGHIGFNEPGTLFESSTHIVNLAPSTIQANARFFNRVKEVPTKAITMGIATIMKSKEILLLISGEEKRETLFRLLNGDVNIGFPASVLKNHPFVTIIADEAAVKDIKIPR
ncbi:glucosamine-6-phosphate deaminase [Neobacillus drentensis]|uniref:glucosamine-6-phosphate deaminase n=1 Tax=Neobacillus drentensis TaxID=220684 RepID=UPI0028630930|nr:glucosamine-6-phosphate deaminase [Neobacillus drentensis]MDR7238826.1 glucosamine-6-phosphate deaminase [Neobacillus drentensis]